MIMHSSLSGYLIFVRNAGRQGIYVMSSQIPMNRQAIKAVKKSATIVPKQGTVEQTVGTSVGKELQSEGSCDIQQSLGGLNICFPFSLAVNLPL